MRLVCCSVYAMQEIVCIGHHGVRRMQVDSTTLTYLIAQALNVDI